MIIKYSINNNNNEEFLGQALRSSKAVKEENE